MFLTSFVQIISKWKGSIFFNEQQIFKFWWTVLTCQLLTSINNSAMNDKIIRGCLLLLTNNKNCLLFLSSLLLATTFNCLSVPTCQLLMSTGLIWLVTCSESSASPDFKQPSRVLSARQVTDSNAHLYCRIKNEMLVDNKKSRTM